MINLKNLQLAIGDIMIEPGEAYRVIMHQSTSTVQLSDTNKDKLRLDQTHQHGIVIALSKDVFDVMEERKNNPKNNLPILEIGTTVIFTLGLCEIWDIPIYEEIPVINGDEQETEKRRIKLPTTINYNNILAVVHNG